MIFNEFGLQMLTQAQKLRYLRGRLYPVNGEQPYRDPKGLRASHTTYKSLTSVQLFCAAYPFTQPQKSCALQSAIHSPKTAPSRRSICTQSNTWFSGYTRLSSPTGVLIGSAVFAQLKPEGPYTLQWADPFPIKLPLPTGRCEPHLLHGSLGQPEPITQTASQSVQPFFAGLTTETDRPRYSVGNNRLHLHT